MSKESEHPRASLCFKFDGNGLQDVSTLMSLSYSMHRQPTHMNEERVSCNNLFRHTIIAIVKELFTLMCHKAVKMKGGNFPPRMFLGGE